MRASLQQIIIVSTCIVTMSQWFDAPVIVGGKTILFLSELTLYLHVLVLLALTRGKLNIPRRILKIFFPLLIYFVAHLLYSVMFADGGNAILTTRRLIYWPFVAMVAGYSTAALVNDRQFINKVLVLNLKLSVVLLILNVVVRFHMFQEFGFISRATGVILSALVFNGIIFLIRQNRISRNQSWIAVVTFLIIFLTSSRGVYLAFFSVLGLMVWQLRKLIGVTRFLKLMTGGLVGLGIIISIALSSPLVIGTLQKFGTDIANIAEGNLGSHGEKFNTLGARYYLYESAFSLGMESPIFGNGSGFKVEQWHLGGSYNIDRSKTAHNYYLDIWYRLGLVGIILFFIFYRRILTDLRSNDESIYYMFLVAMIYSMFDVMLSSTASAIIPIFMLAGTALWLPPSGSKKM